MEEKKTKLYQKTKLYLKFLLCGLILLIVTLIPGILGYLAVKVFGKNFTYLGPFGDYFAGTTGPVLTVISFVALVYTIRQQKEQIDMQKDQLTLQRNEIDDNKIKDYQESLPERIINLEESLDIINENIEVIKILSRQDILETLHSKSHERTLRIFDLNGNYILTKKEEIKKIVEEDMKLIRNKMVRINTESYKIFLDFQESVKVTYILNIRSVEQKLIRFQESILDKYPFKGVLADELEGEFAEANYDEEDFSKLNELKSTLYFQEQKYITDLAQVYYKFKIDLEKMRIKLVSELS